MTFVYIFFFLIFSFYLTGFVWVIFTVNSIDECIDELSNYYDDSEDALSIPHVSFLNNYCISALYDIQEFYRNNIFYYRTFI